MKQREREDFWSVWSTIISLQKRFKPEERSAICERYRKGETLAQIAETLVLKDDNIGIMASVVRTILQEDMGEEYERLAKERVWQWWRTQKKKGIGIHAQSSDDNKKFGWKGAAAIGREPYSEAEIEEILRLSKLPANMKWTQRFHADKIATALLLAFPDGPQRTPKGISNLLNRLREKCSI